MNPTEETKKKFSTRTAFILIISLSIVLVILAAVIGYQTGRSNGYESGHSKASELLRDKKVTAETVDGEIAKIEGELEAFKQEHAEKKEELKKLQTDYEEVTELIGQKGDIEKELAKLESILKEKKEESSSLEKKINGKKQELESLTNGVAAKKAEPRYLPAGVFTVGKDLPQGRYKIQPNGADGNFFVNDGLDANVILGVSADSMYLKEYIMELREGDTIEATLPTKYTPVK